MTSKRDHGDLIALAIILSAGIHALLMFLMASRTMSTGVGYEAHKEHRQVMRVSKYDGDPFKVKVQIAPKDKAAPQAAPKAEDRFGMTAAEDVAGGVVTETALRPEMPKLMMRDDAESKGFEMPKAKELKREAVEPTGAWTIGAPTVEGANLPKGSIEEAMATLVTPNGMTIPRATMTDVEVKSEEGWGMPEETPKAVRQDFGKKVFEGVDERIVEEEKAAVKELLKKPEATIEEFATIHAAVYDGADGRYFRITIGERGKLPIVPKDMVILMDASGSIANDRLRQCCETAKTILRKCANTGDRFNLVAFRNYFSYAFGEWRDYDAQSFAEADRWLGKLAAHGRTDVFSVIRSVLTLPRDPERPIIALVITDGEANTGVSETEEILSQFTALNDGLISVYMYGVKDKANRRLIEMLTRGNRGESFIHYGNRKNAAKGLEPLAAAFRDPVITDMRVMFTAGSEAEIYPKRLRNLYRGRTVTLNGKCRKGLKELVFSLKGLSGSKARESLFKVDLEDAARVGDELVREWAEGKDTERAVAKKREK